MVAPSLYFCHMQIRIVAFGIARDILAANALDRQVNDSTTIGILRSDLSTDYEDFIKLRSLRFAVNEDYVDDSYMLKEGDEVVLIPPVSGG